MTKDEKRWQGLSTRGSFLIFAFPVSQVRRQALVDLGLLALASSRIADAAATSNRGVEDGRYAGLLCMMILFFKEEDKRVAFCSAMATFCFDGV